MHAELTEFLTKFTPQTEVERAVLKVLENMHTGRWPSWTMVAIRREGARLVELAEWSDGRPVVLVWSLREVRVQMETFDREDDARKAYRARQDGSEDVQKRAKRTKAKPADPTT